MSAYAENIFSFENRNKKTDESYPVSITPYK